MNLRSSFACDIAAVSFFLVQHIIHENARRYDILRSAHLDIDLLCGNRYECVGIGNAEIYAAAIDPAMQTVPPENSLGQ